MNIIGTNAEGADSGKCCKCVLLLRKQKSISFKKKKKTAKRYTVEALLVMDDLVGFGFKPKHRLTTGAC